MSYIIGFGLLVAALWLFVVSILADAKAIVFAIGLLFAIIGVIAASA